MCSSDLTGGCSRCSNIEKFPRRGDLGERLDQLMGPESGVSIVHWRQPECSRSGSLRRASRRATSPRSVRSPTALIACTSARGPSGHRVPGALERSGVRSAGCGRRVSRSGNCEAGTMNSMVSVAAGSSGQVKCSSASRVRPRRRRFHPSICASRSRDSPTPSVIADSSDGDSPTLLAPWSHPWGSPRRSGPG